MNINEILPLGSIVSLKNGNGKLMIIGLFQKSESDNKVYDYCALLHPYGYLNSNDIFLFNRDKIDKIYFNGYYDQETVDYYDDVVWANKKRVGELNEEH